MYFCVFSLYAFRATHPLIHLAALAYRGQGLSNILKKVSDEQAAILGKDEYIVCSVVNTTKIPFKAENMMNRDRAYVTARQQTVSLYKSEPQSFFTALERATADRPMDRYRHVDAHALHALLTNTPDDVPASQVTGRHLLMLDWIPYQMCLESLLYLENLGENVKFIAEIRPDGGVDGGEYLASYSAAITKPVVGTRYVTMSTDFTQSGRALSSEQFLDLFTSYALMHKPSALADKQWVYCYDYRGDSTLPDAEKNGSALQQWLAANVEDESVPCFLRRITMTSLERPCTIMT
ncbi:hypothetical protein SARC_07459 [Sphaeroforma arctica JP610]|uniref:Uncharacterized protein n=1 Tax=Sphaeroforma arctica JP610 TaxID=667725 RepID=A0A0L0FTN8_9EUKA|nr:hypothetical protein SARC_07459 [Sphaeroforma arctica JP610]KNC80180.1 hypothetical protein SARC_07459 [Sphaeroforma arctica JP610]|eukprot:XP_014154082.1 hypothetical protein SARC_07459 [Sphaeroforma arctica JP610]